MKSYIFILSPPYSGSTVLWKLLSTSEAVSSLPKEGQFLPEVEGIMRKAPWDSAVKFPWENIKKTWDSYWDQEKPFLLEKSPPNIIRTEEIAKHFIPVHFLIMVRNPYAHCEGLIRRNNWKATEAAKFTVRCLEQQAQNLHNYPKSFSLTYEELVANPESVSRRLEAFIPELGTLNHESKFKVHSIDGHKERGIVDFNRKKIVNLSPNQLLNINDILIKNEEVMAFWGYEIYKPYFKHSLSFINAKSKLLFSKISSKIFNH